MKGDEDAFGVSQKCLEWNSILERVKALADSWEGRKRIGNLFPYRDSGNLHSELDRVTEMKDLLEYGDPFPSIVFEDLSPLLDRCRVEGGSLHPEDFILLRGFLQLIRRIRIYFDERPERYALLQPMVRRLKFLPDLEKAIDAILDGNGEIKDSASPALHRLRAELHRVVLRARKRLESILHQLSAAGYTQEDALVLREGRLVIPVKEPHRGRLKGVVVDQSSSGATLFIEPLEVLEINNDIRRLKIHEKQEIERLLIRLTDAVRTERLHIDENRQAAGDLDALAAKARFSMELKACSAEPGEAGELRLNQARHPLLIVRQEGDVIPLDLEMGKNFKTLIITGPNAGGKTVALKTVGLLSLMHRMGLHIPVEGGSCVPLFNRIFADIGDRQSIQQDLSTFSSHIQNIRQIIEEADEQSLVLLDELGSSTDPAEGTVLAEVFLQTLTGRGCLTLATTHMGSLKVFAHESPDMQNGSMIFDQKTLKPTYRFQLGVPGSSYAFEIAQRLGISPDLVDRARQRLGDGRGRMDDLIVHLQKELQQTHELLAAAENKESRLSSLIRMYEDRIQRLEIEGSDRQKAIIEETEALLRNANVTVENLVREIRETQARSDVIKKAKASLEQQKKKVQEISKMGRPPKPEKKREVHEGEWVTWQGHPGTGQVVSGPDREGRVMVQWDHAKMKLHRSELKPEKPPKKIAKVSGAAHIQISREVRDEISVRGMRVDEALPLVDSYLADARMTGFKFVRIIHGKGTGMLRQAIGEFLKQHPLVKHQRLGMWNEGDTGVTVIELR